MKTDKLSMRNNMEDNIRLNFDLTLYSPQRSRQAIITASPRLGRPQKSSGVITDLFCTGVIGHLGSVFLN